MTQDIFKIKPKLPLMLCKNYNPLFIKKDDKIIIQHKLNGFRARYFQGNIYSKDGNIFHKDIVEHLKTNFKNIPDHIMIDGEFWNPGLRLKEINSAISINKIKNINPNTINFWAFDLVDFNMPDVAFNFRYELLEYIYKGPVVKNFYPNTLEDIEHIYNLVDKLGEEGIIYRVGLCKYVDYRTKFLLKRKIPKNKIPKI